MCQEYLKKEMDQEDYYSYENEENEIDKDACKKCFGCGCNYCFMVDF